MMPGVTCLPRPSTSRAPAGAVRSLPDRRDLAVDDEHVGVLEDPGRPLRPDGRAADDDRRRRGHGAGLARRAPAARRARERPPGEAEASSDFDFALRLVAKLDARAVDPDLGDAALLREGLARLDDEVGDLARRDACRAGRRGRAGAPESSSPPRARRPRDSPRAIASRTRFGKSFGIVEAGGRERELETRVAHPPRVRRRAVEGVAASRAARRAIPRRGRACRAAGSRRAGSDRADPPRPR